MRILALIATALATAMFCNGASASPAAPAAPAPAPAPSGGAVVAAAADARNASTDSLVAVQMISGASHRMAPAEAATLAGDYALSDGSHLRVSFERQRLFADIGQRRMELAHTGGTSFVGRGTAVSVKFDQVPFATDVTVTY